MGVFVYSIHLQPSRNLLYAPYPWATSSLPLALPQQTIPFLELFPSSGERAPFLLSLI